MHWAAGTESKPKSSAARRDCKLASRGLGGQDGTDSDQIGGRSMASHVVNPVAIGLHIQYRNKQSRTLKATQNEKKTLGFILCIVIGEVRGKAEKHLLSRLLVATSACSQTTAVVSATTRRAWWPTPTAPPESGHKTVALPTALLTALNPRCMFVSRPPPPPPPGCSPWLSFMRSRRQSAAATGKKKTTAPRLANILLREFLRDSRPNHRFLVLASGEERAPVLHVAQTTVVETPTQKALYTKSESAKP